MEKGNLPTLLVGMQIGSTTVENSMEVSRNPQIELPYHPAITLPGIYSNKTLIQRDTRTPVFIAALFTIANTWEKPTFSSLH